MSDRRPIESIERALEELQDAKRAGVFESTNVDVRSVLQATTTRVLSPWRLARRVVPVAAALGLVVVGSSWWMGRSSSVMNGHPSASVVAGGSSFQNCFGGPVDSSDSACGSHDYDADGDVDLADYGAYQLAFADVTR